MLVTASARSVTKESGCYCYSGVFTPCNSPIISPIATKKSELLEILSESLKSKHCIEIRELFLTQFSVCLTLRQVSILPFTDAHFLITCDSISHGFIHRENSDNVLFFFCLLASWLRDLAFVKVNPVILIIFSHVILSFWQLALNNSIFVTLISSLSGRSCIW